MENKSQQHNDYLVGLENGFNNIPPNYPDNMYYMQGFYEGQSHYMEMLRRYNEEQQYLEDNYGDIIEF